MAQVALKNPYISAEEYLEGELLSEAKYELINGEVYAMAGTSVNHTRISGNIFNKTKNHLENSPCEPFISDMKVKIGENFYYPDMMVVCDDKEENDYYRTSPVIIVEVLSKSTRQNDRTIKKQDYLQIPTLEEYVLIEQDFAEIEVFTKKDDWRSNYYFLGDELTLDSIGLTITVEDIYYRVKNEDMAEFIAKKEQEAQEKDMDI
jgi:Uma2 family endonuclease